MNRSSSPSARSSPSRRPLTPLDRLPKPVAALLLLVVGSYHELWHNQVWAEERREVAAESDPPVPPMRHAVVIVVDTLRADVLARADAPNMHGLLAHESVGEAWGAGTWTVPSVASMLTGTTVREHGWDLPSAAMGEYPPLPDVPTVASVLSDAGFATAGLYANDYLSEKIGLNRGFQTWKKTSDALIPGQVGQEIGRWGDGKRHFLYVHLLGPHSTLQPSDGAKARHRLDARFFAPRFGFDIGAAKRNEPGARDAYPQAYEAVVEDTDERVGAILKALEPYADQTAVVLVADHGEQFGEHGFFGHGDKVWEQLRHVPLGGRNLGTLPPTLSNAAVADIVTSSVGVEHDWPVKRTSALPLVSQRQGQVALSPDGHLVGVWKDDGFAAYDLDDDPTERHPLTGRDAELEAARAAWEKATPAGTPLPLSVPSDAATTQALQRLGYVDEKGR